MKKKNSKIEELNEFEVKDKEAQQIKGGGCVATLDWDKWSMDHYLRMGK